MRPKESICQNMISCLSNLGGDETEIIGLFCIGRNKIQITIKSQLV